MEFLETSSGDSAMGCLAICNNTNCTGMVASLVQTVLLQMPRNPMVNSLVQSVWLHVARNTIAAPLGKSV